MKKFKLIATVVLAVVLFFVFKNCSTSTPPSKDQAQATESVVKNDSINKIAMETILAEAKVKDVKITDGQIMVVAVLEDGSRQDGFASYCCSVLNELNANIVEVKVVNFNSYYKKIGEDHFGDQLGKCSCDFK